MLSSVLTAIQSNAPAALDLPKADWAAVAPMIALFSGAMVLLLVTTIVPGKLHRSVWTAISVLASLVSVGLSAHLWNRVSEDGAISTLGGAVIVDGMAIFVFVIVALSVLLTALLLDDYLDRERLEPVETLGLLLMSGTGGMVMAAANDLIVLFLGIEILSIAVYVLAASHRRRISSTEAGMKYFLLGSFASAILLYGMALTYGATGSFRLDSIASFLADTVLESRFMLIGGMALILVGLAFKIGAAPFHAWTPDVYQGSPTPIVAYMASAVKVVAFAAILRVFVRGFASQTDDWRVVVGVLAVASLVIGSALAIVQNNVKRTLAYSSIGHVGFILAGVYAASATGSAAVLNYLAIYSLMAIGSFGVLSLTGSDGDGHHTLDSLAGLGRRRPALALAFTILLLAQAGVPFTGGFMAKFGIIKAVTDGNHWWLAIAAMLGAVVSAFLYLRVVGAMYFGEASGDDAEAADVATPTLSMVAIWACTAAVVLIGVVPGILSGLANDATLFSILG